MEINCSIFGANNASVSYIYIIFLSDHRDSVNLVDATVLKVKEKQMILVITTTTDFITTWLVCQESGNNTL